MMIIRKFRGGWPDWIADTDDGRVVFIHIRWGSVLIGIGSTEEEARDKAVEVPNEWDLDGVSDSVDALVALRKHGFHYVAPS